MANGSAQTAAQALEAATDRGVDHPIAELDDEAADQRRIDRWLELHPAAHPVAERGGDGFHLLLGHGMSAFDPPSNPALGLGPQELELAMDLRQQAQAPALGEQRQEVAVRRTELRQALEA